MSKLVNAKEVKIGDVILGISNANFIVDTIDQADTIYDHYLVFRSGERYVTFRPHENVRIGSLKTATGRTKSKPELQNLPGAADMVAAAVKAANAVGEAFAAKIKPENEQIAELKGEVSRLKGENYTLHNKKALMASKKRYAEAALESCNTHVHILIKRLAEKDREIRFVTNWRIEMEDKIATLKADVVREQNINGGLRAQLDIARGVIAALQEDVKRTESTTTCEQPVAKMETVARTATRVKDPICEGEFPPASMEAIQNALIEAGWTEPKTQSATVKAETLTCTTLDGETKEIPAAPSATYGHITIHVKGSGGLNDPHLQQINQIIVEQMERAMRPGGVLHKK